MRRTLASSVFVLLALEPAPGRSADRDLLLVALDAVPYAAAVEGTQALPEAFAAFHPPVPLISTFPSTTSVAFGEILAAHGLERSPGYEARFFDWERREKVGGGPISYRRIHFDWREFFDWNRKGPFRSFLAAVRPVRASVREIEAALERFVEASSPAYLIYIAPTDTALHVHGPEAAARVFAALGAALLRAHERRPARPFDTVVFSDHGIAGGQPLANVREDLQRALRAAGLALVDRLRRPRQVVMVPFGLVSSLELYTAREDEPTALAAAVGVAGVDLCARTTDRGWEVVDAAGAVEFERAERDGEPGWELAVRGSNPLGGDLEADAGGWLREDRATGLAADGLYPDPLRRIVRAFELVDNPASIVCSLAPGFMFGPRHTEWLARLGKGRLRWTHGALSREETLGFVMSDAAEWRPLAIVRAAEALAPFAATVRLARERPGEAELAASGD